MLNSWKLRVVCLVAAFAMGLGTLRAQLTVTASNNALQLVQNLMGSGITVSNVTMNCPNGAAGTFNGTASNIGINNGVLLTTGSVATAASTNNSGSAGVSNGGGSDAQLTQLGGNATFDACALEFDFVALCDTISIAYVFASEEYNEYVCGTVNDVFGFFLTGPGYANTNIAIVPNTNIPVSINTVNNGSVGTFGTNGPGCVLTNSVYYQQNFGNTHQYDGQTVRMLAQARVTPCATYHVKLVVADGGDRVYDSGVFLEQNGINCNSNFFAVNSGLNGTNTLNAIEGCVNGYFTFERTGDSSSSVTLNYTVAGSATMGADYPNLTGAITFGTNQTSVTIPITAFTDGITEGAEDIIIIIRDTICGTPSADTASLTITDNLVVTAGPDVNTCLSTAVGIGGPPLTGLNYSWTPGTYLNATNISNPTSSPTVGGSITYFVEATDANGCIGRDTVTVVTPTQMAVNFGNVQDVSCNGFNDGCIGFTASGGGGNYSYLWNNGVTLDSACGLAPGTYTVTVTDTLYALSGPSYSLCTFNASANIVEPMPLTLAMSAVDVACFGDSTGCVTALGGGGNGNFSYVWNTGDTTTTVCGVPAGTYIVTLTDSTGSTGGGSTNIMVYMEGFNGAHGWILNVPTGVNGADPNFWVTNDNEGGVAAGNCGVANNGDGTLHITSVFNPSGGAAYDAGGLCGLLFCPETNARAESPVISTVALTSPVLDFDFISVGDGLNDNASVLYNDGSGWQVLVPSIKSTVCVNLQGLWQNMSIPLPPSCANNPNLRIGFNWTNNDDGVGSDPSVAINNVRVTGTQTLGGGPGCFLVDTVTVAEPTQLVTTIAGYNLSCNNSSDGAADVDVTGGTLNYTITWSNSGSGDSIFNLSAGTYTAFIEDAQGCTDTIDVTLSEPPAIVASFNVTNVACFGDTSGCVGISATGGPGGNFGYVWSNGATGDSICGLAAGTYYVTISDTTNGGGSQNVTLYAENFNGVSGWTLNVPTGPNGADPNFWVENDNEGGVAPGGCGVANNGDATLHITSVFNPNGGAAYDAGGLCGLLFCPETNSRAESPAFSTVGFSGLTLSLDFISVGDLLNDNASLLYNDGSGWQVLDPALKSGVCVNLQGLWQTNTYTLPASCDNNPNVRIGINWTNNDDGAGVDPSIAVNNILVTAPTLMPGGVVCTAVDSVVITEPTPLSLTTSSVADPCSSAIGTATVVATGGVSGYTYLWNTVPAQTGATATGLLSGNYIVTVTDANNCTDTAHVFVGAIPSPIVSISLVSHVSCFGGSDGAATATFTSGTPSVTYTWNTVPPQTGAIATGLSAGTYIVTGTDANGCQDTAVAVITQPALLAISATADNAICNHPNGSASAAANGGTLGYSYIWSTGQIGANINGLGAGTYGVTVTDSKGCQANTSVQVLQEGSPTVTLASQVNLLCFGANTGSATVNVTGGAPGYTYLWSTVPAQTTPTATGLAAGNYQITVTDANGCTHGTFVNITQPSQLTATTVSTDVTCWAGSNPNGTIGAVTSGGTPGYTYLWSTVPAQTTSYVSGLTPGIYFVTITDANGCEIVRTDTVGLQTNPTVVAGPDASFCEGDGGAQLMASGSGGAPGYFYVWWCNQAISFCGLDSLNDNDPIANPTVSGWYYVQVVDTNGCRSNVDSLYVTVLPKPIVNAGPDHYICGDSAPCVLLTPTITNATGPYTFDWSPGNSLNDSTIMNPCARPDTTTIYTLVVTAGNGCASDFTTTDTLASVTVHVNPIPIADAGPDRDLCLGDSMLLQGIGHGAGPDYTFEWSPSTGLSDSTLTNPNASPSSTTMYSLTVWSNGCPSYADSVEVRVHTIPTVEAGWDREICYGSTTMLDAQAGGDSTATYNFLWTPATGLSNATAEDPDASPALTTTYYVQAITNWGCESTPDSATVYVIPTPIADAGPNQFICYGDTAQLLASFSYMTPDTAETSQIYYSWTPNQSLSDSTVLQPWAWPTTSGWYHVDIRFRTCVTSDSVLVTVGPQIVAMADADTLVICGEDSVQLSSLGSVGTSFHWYPSAGLDDPLAAHPMAAPDTSTTYYLAVGEGACNDTAMVTVMVLPTPTAAYFSSLTEGCVPHSMSFIDASQGAVNYIWNFGDGSAPSNTTQPVHTYEQPGTYTVSLVVQASGACADTVSDIIVTVFDSASAAFASAPEYPVELSFPNTQVDFQNLSINATEWVWDFGDGIISTEVNPSHAFQEAGVYFVGLQVRNQDGCISRVIHGPYVVMIPELFIPNVFSPNGDGINDVFLPEYTGSQPYQLQVFDRWGALQYSNVAKLDGWDGKTGEGAEVPDGVYFYRVKVGNKDYAGNVTLMR